MMRATPPRRLSGVVCAVLVLLTLVLAGTLVMLSDTTDDAPLVRDVPDDFVCELAGECEPRELLQATWPKARLASYNASQCCDEHSVLRELMLESIAFFERHNLTYYVTSGSLLGLQRHEHGVIPWEKDGDLTVIWDSFPKTYAEHEARVALFLKFNTESKVATLTRCKSYEGLCSVAYKVRHRFKKANINVDWFQIAPIAHPSLKRIVDGEDTLVRMNSFWSYFRYRREWMLPTRPCDRKLYGRTVQCPAQPEKFLAYCYGDGWKIGRTGREGMTTEDSDKAHDFWNLYHKRPSGWHIKPSGMQHWGKNWREVHDKNAPFAHCSLEPTEWCQYDRLKQKCTSLLDIQHTIECPEKKSEKD